MKINILTFHYANNYGAVLQCYALSKAIEQMGYSVELLNLIPNKSEKISLKSKLRIYLLNRKFDSFRKNELPKQTEVFSNLEQLNSSYPSADYYVVGSDQVWNPQITKDNSLAYFFSFLKNERRIAYAASFGVEEWNWEVAEVKGLLNKFSAIGIRETQGVELCSKVFNINSEKVVDPTLILNSYQDLLKGEKPLDVELATFKFQKGVDWYLFINNFSSMHKLDLVHINDYKLLKKGKSFNFCSVSKWLNILASSKFIVTDSFHCMVFAIIFKKQFIALPAHKGRTSRMKSLLSDLGLLERFFETYEEVDNKIASEKIDYSSVDKKLTKLKSHSIEFLSRSLNSTKL